MALNIKNTEAERLAAEVARLAGESKTRAVQVALEERRERLALRGASTGPAGNLRHFLESEAWPQVPKKALGKPITRAERERILGYGPHGA